jgi:hypothetical protein
VAGALEGALLGAALTPPSRTIGEGISNVAGGILGSMQYRQDLAQQRMMAPFGLAGVLGGLQKSQADLAKEQAETGKLNEEIATFPAQRDLLRGHAAAYYNQANAPHDNYENPVTDAAGRLFQRNKVTGEIEQLMAPPITYQGGTWPGGAPANYEVQGPMTGLSFLREQNRAARVPFMEGIFSGLRSNDPKTRVAANFDFNNLIRLQVNKAAGGAGASQEARGDLGGAEREALNIEINSLRHERGLGLSNWLMGNRAKGIAGYEPRMKEIDDRLEEIKADVERRATNRPKAKSKGAVPGKKDTVADMLRGLLKE